MLTDVLSTNGTVGDKFESVTPSGIFRSTGGHNETAKKRLSDYTEEEFIAALNWFWNEDITEDEESQFVDQFNELVEHPAKSDLIFYPETDREDSPQGIVNEIKRWYHEKGKVCFVSRAQSIRACK